VESIVWAAARPFLPSLGRIQPAAPRIASEAPVPQNAGVEGDITALLGRVRSGDRKAEGELFTRVHAELARRAAAMLRHQRHVTLETLALVNESYLRLVKQPIDWQDRGHFFAVAATAMRSILVDYARNRARLKRGGGGDHEREPLDEIVVSYDRHAMGLVELDDALSALAGNDARAARIVEMRFFGGLTLSEIAEALGVGLRTVERDWEAARAWLHRELT
jgi:RNA polymerase sigma factor (TIGR02999 family)